MIEPDWKPAKFVVPMGEFTIMGPVGARWWVGTAPSPPPENPKSTTLGMGLLPEPGRVIGEFPKRDFPLLARVRDGLDWSWEVWVEPGDTVGFTV
ncbi:MAG: hypothetical protein DRP42_04815, partial [Tenericutes bacterium]